MNGAPFLDLHRSISNGFVSSKNDKRDDFDFDIVNFPFLLMAMFHVVLLTEYIYSCPMKTQHPSDAFS